VCSNATGGMSNTEYTRPHRDQDGCGSINYTRRQPPGPVRAYAFAFTETAAQRHEKVPAACVAVCAPVFER